MSTFARFTVPDAPAPARTPYVPPETVRSVTVEATEPTISRPAVVGLVTVTSSKSTAA